MVSIKKGTAKRKSLVHIMCFLSLFVVFVFLVLRLALPEKQPPNRDNEQLNQTPKQQPSLVAAPEIPVAAKSCPYTSLNDLTQAELRPKAGPRHMVTPPADTVLTLVCCQTTAGPWNILVHDSWAPRGAARFLKMVRADYFNQQKVPLMRCVPNFLCQFGLAGRASKDFATRLQDDPNWLPLGKEHRQNEAGVKRFARGYLAYAGAGPNSRNNQFIVALKDNGPLAGGSPWEVPWGELVGKHSFDTLGKIYTGYGEKGPSQARLSKAEYMELVETNFPKLDLIESCHVVDERTVS